MSILKQKLILIISASVKALGFEFIGLEIKKSNILTLCVYIDNKNNITADNCADVSYHINAVLNVENLILGLYTLEVSSPGFKRPLFTIAHYQYFIGKKVNLILKNAMYNRRKWKGIIKFIHNELITITVDNKDEIFVFKNIQKANLIPSF